MTASEQAKSYGLKSLAQVAELWNMSEQGLRNWHKNEPQRFDIALLGCVVFLAMQASLKTNQKVKP